MITFNPLTRPIKKELWWKNYLKTGIDTNISKIEKSPSIFDNTKENSLKMNRYKRMKNRLQCYITTNPPKNKYEKISRSPSILDKKFLWIEIPFNFTKWIPCKIYWKLLASIVLFDWFLKNPTNRVFWIFHLEHQLGLIFKPTRNLSEQFLYAYFSLYNLYIYFINIHIYC